MDAEDLETTRRELFQSFALLADDIEQNQTSVQRLLAKVETHGTAMDEVKKTVRALRTYDQELEGLRKRNPIGTVLVSLPFNNPLYSLVLYCFGPLLAGNKVIVRPSSITRHIVDEILSMFPKIKQLAGLKFFDGSGRNFIEKSYNDDEVQGLIFAGSWQNVERLVHSFPNTKRLIYCGSGINPFVVDNDAVEFLSIDKITEMIVESRVHNSGQDCLCTERILVHKSLLKPVVDSLEAKTRAIKAGDFGELDCGVNPLLGGIAETAEIIANRTSDVDWIVPFKREGALVYPSLALANIEAELVNSEKFAPVFTVASYETHDQLDQALDFQHLFGATVCGSFSSHTLMLYPHITRTETVIANESEDAHIPYGGRRRAGFVKAGTKVHDGPILYSFETTTPSGQ